MAKFDYRGADAEGAAAVRPSLLAERPELAYLLPFFAYLLVMVPGGFFGDIWKQYQPELYAAKSVLAGILLWYFWPCYTQVRWSKLWIGALVGLAGTFAWLGTGWLCQRLGLIHPPTDSEIYNPDKMLAAHDMTAAGSWREVVYLCIRVTGPSLVVPLMEELFFRDWLMRLFISPRNFQEVPVGTFRWQSLLLMSVAFGINHGSLLVPGIVYGLMMGILLIRTKSLGACITAHGVTNCTLYLYVIWTGDWQWM